jgi:hypothetical protein
VQLAIRASVVGEQLKIKLNKMLSLKLVVLVVFLASCHAWKTGVPKMRKVAAAAASLALTVGGPTLALAEDSLADVPAVVQSTQNIEKVPLYNKKSGDTQPYNDIGRGFKLLRPFGFNEFQGEGSGYLVKFASLYDVDENVVIGSVPASAGKTSITEYGTLDGIGQKLAAKRKGELKSSRARETDGYVFYEFEFETPLDKSLPRPGSRGAEKTIELYELTVAKGRLWSVQATSNDKIFKNHESSLRASLASFVPRL